MRYAIVVRHDTCCLHDGCTAATAVGQFDVQAKKESMPVKRQHGMNTTCNTEHATCVTSERQANGPVQREMSADPGSKTSPPHPPSRWQTKGFVHAAKLVYGLLIAYLAGAAWRMRGPRRSPLLSRAS